MTAITAELVETGEKRDTRRRRVTPGERRTQCVQAYRASGLTMAEFARREKLNYATFAGWVAKADKPTPAKSPIKFAEVRLPFAPPGMPADAFAHLPVAETIEIVPEAVKQGPDLYERIGEERTFEVDIVDRGVKVDVRPG